jgi:hypothetical protein
LGEAEAQLSSLTEGPLVKHKAIETESVNRQKLCRNDSLLKHFVDVGHQACLPACLCEHVMFVDPTSPKNVLKRCVLYGYIIRQCLQIHQPVLNHRLPCFYMMPSGV